jgi:hypothetical protein
VGGKSHADYCRYDVLEHDRIGCAVGVIWLALIVLWGCAGERPSVPRAARPVKRSLPRVGYTIQVGAFADPQNALHLTEVLQRQGLKAYYFVHKTGLYKVRFGDFPSSRAARERAEILRKEGVVEDYYIVSPERSAAARSRTYGTAYLRAEIVKTAEGFLGVPYRWGGSSEDEGFDCSGLTMIVYQLNGLDLPRSSREQWVAGDPVDTSDLEKGDLVFFSITDNVSHVGIYAGRGKFIHAPGRGKRVRMDSLSKSYFRKRLAGARGYL